MAWDALTTANVTVGKFWTTTIATKIKDCLEYLYAFAGASGNLLNNGSFELDSDGDGDPDSWTIETYAGGSAALYTTAPAHGAQAMSFIHPGGASNGGGYATSDYVECSEFDSYWLAFMLWATAAGMKNIVQVQYYTKAKVANGAAVALHTSTTNETTATRYCYQFTPSADSRYFKVILIGGYTDTDVAGTIYFDDVSFGEVISQAKLKTSLGELSVEVPATTGDVSTANLPGGEYGFMLQTKTSTGGQGVFQGLYNDGQATSYESPCARFTHAGSPAITCYAQQRYVTASGNVNWLFGLRDIKTKEVLASWMAPDHPCFGNGGDPELMPHPFPGYDPKFHEIIVINPTHEELAEIQRRAIGCKKSILQIINEEHEIDDEQEPEWPTEPISIGLPAGCDYHMAKSGDMVIPLRAVIAKPEMVKMAGLKKKR